MNFLTREVRLKMGLNGSLICSRLVQNKALDGGEENWIMENLNTMRKYTPCGTQSRTSLQNLLKIYTGARNIQGGIVASLFALPSILLAGEKIRSGSFKKRLNRFKEAGIDQTNRFLSGSRNHKLDNDYPEEVKEYIAAIAGLFSMTYGNAYDVQKRQCPEIVSLCQQADELQRITWGELRRAIEIVLPECEIVKIRRELPLISASDKLISIIKERTNIRVPARVMQRDNWRDVLAAPQQSDRIATFNSIEFFVENAETAISYCLGSLLTRMLLENAPNEQILKNHVMFTPQEIAAGTKTVTHLARFQSKVGARPNDFRSFTKFLQCVEDEARGACLDKDGKIQWNRELNVQGGCPMRNLYVRRNEEIELLGGAKRALEEKTLWSVYANCNYATEPKFYEPISGELLGALVVFATIEEGSPFRPDTLFMGSLLRRFNHRKEKSV